MDLKMAFKKKRKKGKLPSAFGPKVALSLSGQPSLLGPRPQPPPTHPRPTSSFF